MEENNLRTGIQEDSPFIKVFSREWRRISRRWPLLFTTFIGPLFSFLLIVWLFSGNVPRELPVAVIDLDHTRLSRQMIRMIDATPVACVSDKYTSLAEAQHALEKGTVDAVVYIPRETEKDILKGKSASVIVYLHNGNVVKSGLLNSGIRKAAGTLSAGIRLQHQLKAGITEEQAMARIMPVQMNGVLLFNPYTSYSYYLTVGLLPLILVVFTLLGTIYALGEELYRGTGPKLLRLSGKNIAVALSGKLIPYTVIYFCVSILMNIILFRYLGLPLRGSLHVIIVSGLLMILSYQFIALFLVALTTNMRLAMSLGSAYCMLALTFSGLTFPVSGMPAFPQAFSLIFPYTYYIDILMGQSLRGEAASAGVLSMYAMFMFIVLGLLYVPRYSYMLLNKKRWGKK